MIDHVSVAVANLAVSAEFYDRVLRPLGLKRMTERESTIGFGRKYPEFWLNARPGMAMIPEDTGNHVCLRAPTTEAVVSVYQSAIALGGRGDGEPGQRQATMTTYFGAFIRDLDGNKIEVVTFPREGDVREPIPISS